MNWQPAGRAFTLGASKNIDELVKESEIEPHLRKWSRYWIDERMRKTIANSFGEIACRVESGRFIDTRDLYRLGQSDAWTRRQPLCNARVDSYCQSFRLLCV
jgi:hypothetical protein